MPADTRVSNTSKSSNSNNPYILTDDNNDALSYDSKSTTDTINLQQDNPYKDIQAFINMYLGGVKVTPQDMLGLYERLLQNTHLSDLDQQQLIQLQAQLNALANQKGDINLSYAGKILDKLYSELKEYQKSSDLSKQDMTFTKELLLEIQDMKNIYNNFYDEMLKKQLLAIPTDQKIEFNNIFKEKIGVTVFSEAQLNSSNINDATVQINLAQTVSQEGNVNTNNFNNQKNNSLESLKKSKKEEVEEIDFSNKNSRLSARVSKKTESLEEGYSLSNQLPLASGYHNFENNLGIYSQNTGSNDIFSSISLTNVDGLTRAALVLIMVSGNSAEALNSYSERLYSISSATKRLTQILNAFQQLQDFYTLHAGETSSPVDLFLELQLYLHKETDQENNYKNTIPGFADKCKDLLDLLAQHVPDMHMIPDPKDGGIVTLDAQKTIMTAMINDFNANANYVNGDLTASSIFKASDWADPSTSKFYSTDSQRFIFTRSSVKDILGVQSSTGAESGGVLSYLSQLVTSANSANQTMVAKENLMSQGVTQFFSLVQSTVSYLSKLIQ